MFLLAHVGTMMFSNHLTSIVWKTDGTFANRATKLEALCEGPTVAAHQLVTMSNLLSKIEMTAVKHMDQSQRVFGSVLVMFFCLD